MTATRVCALHELEPEAARRVVVDGQPIAVVRAGDGQVHAIGDTCTHGEISLADGFVDGDTIECWAHGSAFSLCTGRPLNLPAYEPVPVYEVIVDGDDVMIDPTVTKEV
jgi:3-phenylpropionate/trans-cinnamate dioxygenase ferredoxin subunit